jgi:hypothetical protein
MFLKNTLLVKFTRVGSNLLVKYKVRVSKSDPVCETVFGHFRDSHVTAVDN